MIFIDNKYTRTYYRIINAALTRSLPTDAYVERHHIVPQSFYKSRSKTGWLLGDYNSKKNLVSLTAREHFICHVLLSKMTTGAGYFKMACALNRFAFSKKSNEFMNARKYAYIRKTHVAARTGRKLSTESKEKMRRSALNRAPASAETCKKLSEAAKRRNGFSEEGQRRVIEANRGRIWTEESKQKSRDARARQVERQGNTMTLAAREKLSIAAKGRTLSKEHIEKIRKANIGKTMSQEFKDAASARQLGHVKSEETIQKLRDNASKATKPKVTCPYCNKQGGAPSMKRWHMDNCRHK